MTNAQIRARARAERRREEQRRAAEVRLGIFALIVLLVLYGIAGTLDYQDAQRYQSAWEQVHG